jgi:hypothetical protein
VLVASTTLATLSHDEPLLVGEQLANHFTCFVVLDNCANGDSNDLVLARAPIHVPAFAMFSAFGSQSAQVLEIQQRGASFVADKNDAAPMPTVTA